VRDREFKDGPDLSHRLALGLEEVAAALGINEKTVRERLNEIPHTRIGRRLIFPVEPLRRWLEASVRDDRAQEDSVVERLLGD
jgi:excisionase family DNA binding protein